MPNEPTTEADLIAEANALYAKIRVGEARDLAIAQYGIAAYAKGRDDSAAQTHDELTQLRAELSRLRSMEYDITIIDLQREILELKATLAAFHHDFPEVFADNNFDEAGEKFLLEYEQLQFDKQTLEADNAQLQRELGSAADMLAKALVNCDGFRSLYEQMSDRADKYQCRVERLTCTCVPPPTVFHNQDCGWLKVLHEVEPTAKDGQ